MTAWEYDIRSVRTDEWINMKRDLDEIGIDGWELIKMSDDTKESGMKTAVFKRPVDYVDM